jgi:peptidoglycan hydrolase-like protein with peptidoglycan-binding domain
MAYKKPVQGRSYPFLYNVSMTVGSRKSVSHSQYQPTPAQTGNAASRVNQAVTAASGTAVQSVTKYTASYEPNKREDVMLVQYLLKRVYQQGQNCNPPLKSAGGDPHSPASLKIDGIYGPNTQGAIEHFQLEMRRNGRNIATDGCVDTERGDSATASISHTGYTISWLNKYFWVLYPQLAPDMTVDPECPAELKQALNGGFMM